MKHVKLRGLESLGLVGPDKTARQLRLMTPAEFTAWRDAGDAALQDWIAANAFTGTAGGALVLAKSLFGNTPDDRHACDAIGIIGDVPIWDAAAIARALRLRQIGGLVAIDLPRAKPPVMRRVRDDLDMALAAIPRSPEILGQTRGGVLECRLAYGHPFPTDLGGRMASEVLGVLRQIAWRPTMAAPAIEISPAMADWLDTEGGPALAALDRPVRRIVLSGATVPGLVEPGYD